MTKIIPHNFQRNDGGRAEAGFRGTTGDCVTRAIAIGTGMSYSEVYDLVNEAAKGEKMTQRRKRRGRSSARTGVYKATIRRIMDRMEGWTWTPTMGIGTGCRVHLRSDELPDGRLIVSVSKHIVAVIDGVIHDTHDPSRCGTRCVYGYWQMDATDQAQ